MKALILAGGRGSRIDEISSSMNKCMIKIEGKHAIEYSLDCVAETSIDEIIIVVGYRAEEIINYFGNRYRTKRISYVIQWEQKGLVHAIECAKEEIAGHDFMLLFGDEIMLNPKHQEMLDAFQEEDAFALCGILQVDNKDLIKRTYTLMHDATGQIFRLIEKPRQPLNDLMGTGDCVFANAIFDYIEETPIHHTRNEKDFPGLIQCAIDGGKLVRSFLICDKYANINSIEDVRYAESFMRFNPTDAHPESV
jgi:dTDP-glucose pyrophosphorylase